MQNYKPLAQLLKRAGTVEISRTFLRPFASVATTKSVTVDKSNKSASPTTAELSNRQKFNQIQPPIKLYEKLEKLGFGTLLKTKRFAGVHKQKAKRDQQRSQYTERVGPPPEPKYAVRMLTQTRREAGVLINFYTSFLYYHFLQVLKHQSLFHQNH
jgi:hypothetical protein